MRVVTLHFRPLTHPTRWVRRGPYGTGPFVLETILGLVNNVVRLGVKEYDDQCPVRSLSV